MKCDALMSGRSPHPGPLPSSPPTPPRGRFGGRGSVRLIVLMASTALAQHRPLPPKGPQELAAPSLAVHVLAHEDLDPDRLRSLARPRVTLWLSTGSNVLRASTLDNLRRFESAYVALRAPITESQARSFEKIPR